MGVLIAHTQPIKTLKMLWCVEWLKAQDQQANAVNVQGKCGNFYKS